MDTAEYQNVETKTVMSIWRTAGMYEKLDLMEN